MTTAISRTEFIVLIAMMFAGIALSTDAMLPAFPVMAQDLTPEAPNQIQLVVAAFVMGMGVGTFFTGPMSDSFGRKPVILGGAVLFILASVICAVAQSLEVLLLARFLQGLGASGPRVVALAVIRDLFAGPQMARMISFVMIVFTVVPAVAPSIGAAIVAVSHWRMIFVLFVVYAIVYCIWMMIRLPETLAPENKRPFRAKPLATGLAEVVRHPMVRLCILAQVLCFAMLFALIVTIQPLFDETFGRGDTFHLWFGGVAVVAASSGFVNATLVVRIGILPVVRGMLAIQCAITALMIGLWLSDPAPLFAFLGFVLWMATLFYQAGLTLGNINALAMEPMGHIAGTAASVVGALATVGGISLAVPVGLAFDGTPLPLAGGTLIMTLIALWLVQRIARIKAQSSQAT